jgi:hypothetical protein
MLGKMATVGADPVINVDVRPLLRNFARYEHELTPKSRLTTIKTQRSKMYGWMASWLTPDV